MAVLSAKRGFAYVTAIHVLPRGKDVDTRDEREAALRALPAHDGVLPIERNML